MHSGRDPPPSRCSHFHKSRQRANDSSPIPVATISRTKRFASALASGYLALAANVVYTLASIPLALHYLTREEFGLWAVVGQITGYFALLDFGVGQSVSRILIDYKDDVNGGEYG